MMFLFVPCHIPFLSVLLSAYVTGVRSLAGMQQLMTSQMIHTEELLAAGAALMWAMVGLQVLTMCVIQQTGTLLERQVAVLALVWSVRTVRVHVSLQCDFSSSCVIA